MIAPPPTCHKTFTPPMALRALHKAYRPGHRITHRDRLNLTRYIRCQRHPKAKPALHREWARLIQRRAVPALSTALASWYDDSGTTGCGFHATYGIATFIVGCGGHVTLQGPGGTVVATRDDSGPYIAGRTFDLNPATKAALGCGDLCSVRYRVGG
jgi:hypothetical protein